MDGTAPALDRSGFDPQTARMVSQVVQLFSNPASGSYRARRLRALVRALEARGAIVHRSESRDGIPIIRDDATHVCVAAGDGTVRHVAGAVARTGRPLALSVYPAGTINLLAREAGYPRRPEEFARLVLATEPQRRHYAVAIDNGYFFACAGVGPDSLAVASVAPGLKRAIGRLAYAVAFLRRLPSWPRRRIALTCDGRDIACEAFYVAKGRYYAGDWSFAPAARLDEPLMHVVALTTARRRDYFRFVWTLFRRGDVARLANVEIATCTSLSATADEALPIQADGDVVGALPATLTLSEAPLIFC
ncbi:MAG TPA: diacylglycerol kinase family protein [Croceibacterium sp.]